MRSQYEEEHHGGHSRWMQAAALALILAVIAAAFAYGLTRVLEPLMLTLVTVVVIFSVVTLAIIAGLVAVIFVILRRNGKQAQANQQYLQTPLQGMVIPLMQMQYPQLQNHLQHGGDVTLRQYPRRVFDVIGEEDEFGSRS